MNMGIFLNFNFSILTPLSAPSNVLLPSLYICWSSVIGIFDPNASWIIKWRYFQLNNFWNIWINNVRGFYGEMLTVENFDVKKLKLKEKETETLYFDTCWSISNLCGVQIKQKLKFGCSNIKALIVHEGFAYD